MTYLSRLTQEGFLVQKKSDLKWVLLAGRSAIGEMFAKTCVAGNVNGACFSSHSTEEPVVSFRVNFFPKNWRTDKQRIKIRGGLSLWAEVCTRWPLQSLLNYSSLKKLCWSFKYWNIGKGLWGLLQRFPYNSEYKRLQRGILGESKQQSSLSNRHLSRVCRRQFQHWADKAQPCWDSLSPCFGETEGAEDTLSLRTVTTINWSKLWRSEKSPTPKLMCWKPKVAWSRWPSGDGEGFVDAFPSFPKGFPFLLSPVREHIKETCEVAAEKEQTEQNWKWLCVCKGGWDSRSKIYSLRACLSRLQRFHHCQKLLS